MSYSRAQLTVALPTFNGRAYIEATLQSVLAQRTDCPDFALLLCDDRSEDDTVELARSLAGGDLRVVVNPKRLGLAENWNRCVELADTKWVTVFHQDDLMKPGHLSHRMSAIEQHAEAGMVFGGFDVIDEAGHMIPSSQIEQPTLGPNRIFARGAFLGELAASNPVRCSTVVLNKSAHQAVGGFARALRYAVDWEFWARLAQRYSVVWQAEPSVSVRWHEASETHRFRDGKRDIDEVAAVIDLIQAEMDLPGLETRLLRRKADRLLAQAYLNRAHAAARKDSHGLAALCLRAAMRHDRVGLSWLIRHPRVSLRLLLMSR